MGLFILKPVNMSRKMILHEFEDSYAAGNDLQTFGKEEITLVLIGVDPKDVGHPRLA